MQDTWTILAHLLLAAFLGAVGQLVRVVAGLKKESDLAGAKDQSLASRFHASELLTSLGIAIAVGAIAGVLVAVQDPKVPDTKTLLMLMGAGYSGTDFIEAFMKKAVPN